MSGDKPVAYCRSRVRKQQWWVNLYAGWGAGGLPAGPWGSDVLGVVFGDCLTSGAGGKPLSGVGGWGPALGSVISCKRLYTDTQDALASVQPFAQ